MRGPRYQQSTDLGQIQEIDIWIAWSPEESDATAENWKQI